MNDAFVKKIKDERKIAIPNLNFDIYAIIIQVIGFGLSEIPVIGNIGMLLFNLFNILYPRNQLDVWAQIQLQVEVLIDQKITELKLQQLAETLGGLANAIVDYLEHIELKYSIDKLRTEFSILNKLFLSKNVSICLWYFFLS